MKEKVKKIYRGSIKKMKAGVAVLISDKINFKAKYIIRDKESHYIMAKRASNQKHKIIPNLYVPNNIV